MRILHFENYMEILELFENYQSIEKLINPTYLIRINNIFVNTCKSLSNVPWEVVAEPQILVTIDL